MTASVLAIVIDRVVDGRPVVGFGFNSNGRYAPQGLLRERFIPRLMSARSGEIQGDDGFIDPHKAWGVCMRNEKPDGHGERSVAMGVIDMAIWDALSKAHGVPLWRLLADRYNEGRADSTAWVYAAGGYYYPGKGVGELQDEMRSYLDRGYTTVKMKIGLVPLREDLERIEAVLQILGGDGSRLCVDVNGRFNLQEAIAFGNAVASYGLRWYEEPVDPLDYLAHAALATTYAPPLATGESFFSMQDAT
jgi:D(-)-tartrate dehydratase